VTAPGEEGVAAVPGPLDVAARAFDPHTGAPVAPDTAPVAVAGHGRTGRWEPPRYCGVCARRMVVQVRPDGWSARCSRHGTADSRHWER